MTYKIISTVSVLLIFVGSSFGQNQNKEYKLDSMVNKCIAKSAGDFAMSSCFAKAESDWDKELNKYYKLLMAKLDTAGQRTFRESQRQWLVYKDKEIGFLIQVFGKKQGSMWDLLISEKRMQLIRQRSIELLDYYETLVEN